MQDEKQEMPRQQPLFVVCICSWIQKWLLRRKVIESQSCHIQLRVHNVYAVSSLCFILWSFKMWHLHLG